MIPFPTDSKTRRVLDVYLVLDKLKFFNKMKDGTAEAWTDISSYLPYAIQIEGRQLIEEAEKMNQCWRTELENYISINLSGAWDYKQIGNTITLYFEKEIDAIAFRLRF
jgi:thioredoxin reductase